MLADERTIAASVHGRYLVAPPVAGGPAPLLVGFHGYAETAEAQLGRLRCIPGADRWLLASVQALHTFYRGRSQDVVASWMTRERREVAIADNTAYISAVVDNLAHDYPLTSALVFAGFSQGAAMAFRAAAASARAVCGVISLGGDVPPELNGTELSTVRSVLLGRGTKDEWYTDEKFARDRRRLIEAGVDIHLVEIEAAHEWTDAFALAASGFLDVVIAR